MTAALHHPALEPQAQRPVRLLPFAGGSLQTDSSGIAPAEPKPHLSSEQFSYAGVGSAPSSAANEGLGKPILDLAEALQSYFVTPLKIERPKHISTMPQRLTRFPDCPLCALNVNDCRCDPDAYAAAVYARRSA